MGNHRLAAVASDHGVFLKLLQQMANAAGDEPPDQGKGADALMTRLNGNIITGRQLRAARVLAGLTQRMLGAAIGVNERQIRFWERRHHSKPSGARHHASIERVLFDHGVILFAEPSPGARLTK